MDLMDFTICRSDGILFLSSSRLNVHKFQKLRSYKVVGCPRVDEGSATLAFAREGKNHVSLAEGQQGGQGNRRRTLRGCECYLEGSQALEASLAQCFQWESSGSCRHKQPQQGLAHC